jgi:hypothetical protein
MTADELLPILTPIIENFSVWKYSFAFENTDDTDRRKVRRTKYSFCMLPYVVTVTGKNVEIDDRDEFKDEHQFHPHHRKDVLIYMPNLGFATKEPEFRKPFIITDRNTNM